MKVWCLPINLPDPETEPEQARAAGMFIGSLKGLKGVCKAEGCDVLAFDSIEGARGAKWRLEEYNATGLEIIEGRMTRDGKQVSLQRIVKGG